MSSAIPHTITLLPASAGTGKTFRVVEALRDLVLDEGEDLARVVVVTFTEAAARELRDRVRARFVEARAGLSSRARGEPWDAPDDALGAWVDGHAAHGTAAETAERAWRTLVAFDTCCVTTIHGFCSRVLTEAAFEAGAPFATNLLPDTNALLGEVVDDFWLRHTWGAPPETLASLAALGIERDAMRHLAGRATDPTLLVVPDDPGRPAPVDLTPWRERVARALDLVGAHGAEVCELLEASPHLQRRRGPGVAVAITPYRIGQHFARLPGWLESGPVPGQGLPDAVVELSSRWLAGATKAGEAPPRHALLDALQSLVDEQARLSGALRDWKLSLQHEIIADTRARIAAALRRHDALTFDALLRRVRDPLVDPAASSRLRQAVRRRYDAAVVDEFQDTDACQWDIFRVLFGDRLLLVGDPKQAIYSFRGADFATYRRAEAKCVQAGSLSRNFRTDGNLVRAIHHLFARETVIDPMFDPGIPFPVIQPAHPDSRLVDDPRPPLHLRMLSREGRWLRRYRWLDRRDLDERLPRMVANDVVRELRREGHIRTRDGGSRPIGPGDCAVLTRTNGQARAVAHALMQRGVPAVVRSDDSVLGSAERGELAHVLRAVHEPLRTDLIRRAWLTALLGGTAADLVALQSDDEGWLETAGRFRRWRALWEERGVLAVVGALLDEGGVASRLLAQGRERALTNVRHLGELLQRVAVERRLTPGALLTWLDDGATGLDPEDAALRVETDAEAVQCVTVHSAKGLQYPLVWAPWLLGGSWTAPLEQAHLVAQDPELPDRRRLDLGSADRARLLETLEQDRFAEDLRLAYVALTRAEHRCVVYWGAGGSRAALGWVIHQRDWMGDRAERWAHQVENRTSYYKGDAGEKNVPEDLAVLAKHPHIDWDLADWGDADVLERWEQIARDEGELRPAEVRRPSPPDRAWCRTSFTGLSREISPLDPRPEIDHDEREGEGEAEEAHHDPVPTAELPGSARFGNLLHGVLERHVPARGQAELRLLLERGLAAEGLPAAWLDTLVPALTDALRAPLLPDGFALGDLHPEARWAELAFHLPLHGGFSPTGELFSTKRLAAAFDGPLGPGLDASWREHLARLTFLPARGFLVGSIDLVFRHGGRWYLADYKSNRLGPSWRDYGNERLRGPMMEALYPLQYHLYAVALLRLLRRRVPDFDADRDFGGVLYLFLRGMSPTRPSHGVFFDRPPPALLDRLDAALGGQTA